MKEKVSPKRLFANHYKSLCYYAWDMVKDSALAEDLVQDAFLAYWDQRHLPSLTYSWCDCVFLTVDVFIAVEFD